MLKIGLDAKRAFHNFRGLGSYSRNIIAGLKHFYPENELFLYTPKFKERTVREFPHFYENTKVITPSGFWKHLPSVWRRRCLSSLVAQDQLDIYHGLSHELPLGIERWKGKKIVTIHDLQYLRFPKFFPWIDRKVYTSKVKHACEVADIIIAICEFTKSDLINFLHIPEEKIVVHYQSCAEIFYPEKRSELLAPKQVERPYILNVGAFVPNKNQLTLLKAFSDIHDKVEHDLILVGNSGNQKYKTELIGYINKHNLHQRVKIVTDITQEELASYYFNADIFCFPSFFEGFGIPIIEAMFCSTPVITSKTSSLIEVGGDAANFVNPIDRGDIADKLLTLISRPELKQGMVEKGDAHVQQFHWKNTTQNLIQIYNS